MEPDVIRKTATCIRRLNEEHAYGTQFLWKFDPPMEYRTWRDGEVVHHSEYGVTSAIDHAFASETYLFASDEEGEWMTSDEQEGSSKGPTPHAYVIARAGYEAIVPQDIDLTVDPAIIAMLDDKKEGKDTSWFYTKRPDYEKAETTHAFFGGAFEITLADEEG
jgi:hypothetical protein